MLLTILFYSGLEKKTSADECKHRHATQKLLYCGCRLHDLRGKKVKVICLDKDIFVIQDNRPFIHSSSMRRLASVSFGLLNTFKFIIHSPKNTQSRTEIDHTVQQRLLRQFLYSRKRKGVSRKQKMNSIADYGDDEQ